MLKENMEKRIELESRGRPANEISELNLDNCRATQIEGLTDEYVNLQSVSLINVGLITLKGFPNLPNLKRLELSDNRISSGLNNLQGCTTLQYINLSGNKIKDIETLEPLKDFLELRNLDLFNCEVTNAENYREKVFDLLTDLEYLDGFDKTGGEAEDPDDPDDVDGEDDDDVSEDEEDDEPEVIDEEDDDDSDGEDEDGLQEDDDVEDDDEVGLDYLQKEDLSDDEDDFDPEVGQVVEDDDEEGEEEAAEEEEEARGVKRKLDEEEDA